MTRSRPRLVCSSVCLSLLCGGFLRADDASDPVALEIAVLREEVASLERRLLPPVLLDRAAIEAVFGIEATETFRGRGGLEVTRYPLRADATLDVCYVDGHAAVVRLHRGGEAGGRPYPPSREVIRAELQRRRELCLSLLEAYRDRLPPGGMTLPDGVCRELVVYLTDHPASRLSQAIIEHLPEGCDAELLPRLIGFPGKEQESWVERRLRALAERRPESLGEFIAALADEGVDEVRKETLTGVLLVVSGYGGLELDSPWFWRVWRRHGRAPDDDVRRERARWWQEWWARHREDSRLDRLMEPLAIEKHRSNACVALGHLEDPSALPILAGLLDDASRKVRLYAASALLRRKYEGRRYKSTNFPDLDRDEDAVMAEARAWARSRGLLGDGASGSGAPAGTDTSGR